MESNVKKILEKMERLNDALKKEYSRLSKKYGFSVRQKHVIFLKKFRERNRVFRIPAWKYVIPRNIRHILSIPFIYMMVIPVLILDIFVSLFQFVAFSLYEIPKVKRGDYIQYDRRFLDYLNWIEKIHCLYCSYVNGLFAYALEISARTERYWCPIKSATKPKFYHSWYRDFADYGNPEEWIEKVHKKEAFASKQEDKKVL